MDFFQTSGDPPAPYQKYGLNFLFKKTYLYLIQFLSYMKKIKNSKFKSMDLGGDPPTPVWKKSKLSFIFFLTLP